MYSRLYIIHNIQKIRIKRKPHYTRERERKKRRRKTYEKDDGRERRKECEIVLKEAGRGGEIFPVSVHIYHHKCVLLHKKKSHVQQGGKLEKFNLKNIKKKTTTTRRKKKK